MHSLLEHYLTEVTRQLGPLPVARRNEELREVRQHLLDAVTVNQEMGQNEDEAAINAIEQCGTPEELAQGLVQAWKRGVRLNYRDFWGTVAGFWVMEQSLWKSVDLLPHHTQIFLTADHPWPVEAALFSLAIGEMLLIGTVVGLTFPRRAVAGILLPWGLGMASYLTAVFTLLHKHQSHLVGISTQAFYLVIWGCIPAFAAFLASRWRMARPWRGLERPSRSGI